MKLLLLVLAVPLVASAVTVSKPVPGSVSSPFTISASGTCDSKPVRSFGWSLDDGPTTIVSGSSLDVSAKSPLGKHTLHVKAWPDSSQVCVVNVAVDVVPPVVSLYPPNAVVVSNIQNLGWKTQHDPGTDGESAGTTLLAETPSVSGSSREFETSYSDNGGQLYYVSFGSDTASKNFLYDTWIYLDSTNSLANVETDMNQVLANGTTVIYGFQCDGWNGTWDYTKNAGTAIKPIDHWAQSSAKCNPRNWTTEVWHHIQVTYSRDDVGNVTYHSVWLDGTEQPINETVFSGFSLGWASVLLTNFQIDGLGSGTTTAYLDKTTVYRW